MGTWLIDSMQFRNTVAFRVSGHWKDCWYHTRQTCYLEGLCKLFPEGRHSHLRAFVHVLLSAGPALPLVHRLSFYSLWSANALRYNLHAIFTNSFTHWWVLIGLHPWNSHDSPGTDQLGPSHSFVVLLCSSLSLWLWPEASTDLLFCLYGLALIFIVFCKWNHIVCALLCLISFMQCKDFETHTCCMWEEFAPFYW